MLYKVDSKDPRVFTTLRSFGTWRARAIPLWRMVEDAKDRKARLLKPGFFYAYGLRSVQDGTDLKDVLGIRVKCERRDPICRFDVDPHGGLSVVQPAGLAAGREHFIEDATRIVNKGRNTFSSSCLGTVVRVIR